MNGRLRRRQKRQRKDMLGFALMALSAFAVGGVGFAASRLATPPFSPVTLCLTGRAPPTHTMILVDATDALDVRHLRRLKTVVREEAARLPRWGRLTLESLPGDPSAAPRKLFTGCTPGDRTNTSPLWENVTKMETLKRDRFDGALEAALSPGRQRSSARASPIVEGLAAAADDPDFQGTSRRLVLVSDLLQFTPGGYSAYAPGADWAAYLNSPHALRTPPSLSSVAVRVIQLERPDRAAAQEAARTGFWGPYFSAADAHAVAWED